MKKYLASFLFLIFSLSAITQTVKVYKTDSIGEREGKSYYIHTVLQSQTVYSIAKAYDVSQDEIYFENPQTKEGISIDQLLWIPTVNRETELKKELRSARFEFFYYIVKSNETFERIAFIYNIPVETVRQANPEISEPLREGEYIKIPVESKTGKTVAGKSGQEKLDPVSFDPQIPVIPNYRHVVSAGETLYSISGRYGITVEQIRAVNPGMASTLEIGDRLRIPDKSQISDEKTLETKEKTGKPQAQEYYTHKVKKKETLYAISRLYGVSVESIYEANPGLTSRISVGQVLKVPKLKVERDYVVYVVDRKSKLSKVAKLYNIPVADLQKENPSLGKKLYAGQRVMIPVGRFALKQMEEADEIEIKETEKEIVELKETPKPAKCRKIEPIYDKVFKVALMVPLYVEETDSLDVEQFLTESSGNFLPFKFIQFYEGALIAVDSLQALGLNIKLYVYDVDESITKTSKVLQNMELRTMDLIIGPFHNYSFDQVALYAGNFNIPIVNPLSFREEVIEKYKTAIKVKSAIKYQVDLVPSVIPIYYPDYKVWLISHTSYKDADLVTDLYNNVYSVVAPEVKVSNNDIYNLAVAVAHRDVEKDDEGNEVEFDENAPLPVFRLEGIKILPDSIEIHIADSMVFDNRAVRINYMKDSIHPILNNASPLRKNLVILYGDNKAFTMDAMNRLNEFRDTFNIKLIGMPTIEKYNNIDHIQSNNMNLTYFSNTHLNYYSDDIQDFVYKFRSKYHTEPGIYGFSGFDVTYYFLNALFYLDDQLQDCLQHVPLDMLLNRFQFERNGGSENFENTHWNLIRYDHYRKMKLPDPAPFAKEPE